MSGWSTLLEKQVATLKAEVATSKAQRDTLLAALTRIVEWNNRPMENGQPTEPGITQIQLHQARAAIAACKPE
jgi:hypothetical protein